MAVGLVCLGLLQARAQVSNVPPIPKIAAGANHTVGVKAEGTALAAGDNTYRQCNVSNWSHLAAVAAGGDYTLALKDDGTVVATGNDSYLQSVPIAQWRNIVAIAVGQDHAIGVKADGTAVGAGYNAYGQCDVWDWRWTNLVAVAAAGNHTVGLKADGFVIARGDNSVGQTAVSDWSNVVAIAAGRGHSVGLKADGTVMAVGNNYSGQCNVTQWAGIVAVAAGHYHTVGLRSDGAVIETGNVTGAASWTNIVAIAAGGTHTVGLKTDGTVIGTGTRDTTWDWYLSSEVVPPIITLAPTNQAVLVETTNVLFVGAAGPGPFAYQWRKDQNALVDGGRISGAATARLIIANIQLLDAGDYTVAVSNLAGAVTTAVARLEPFALLPTIIVAPTSQLLLVGRTVDLRVAAVGSGSLTYQWRKDGQELRDGGRISGASTTNLLITNAQFDDAGDYTVIVASPYGTNTSPSAALAPRPRIPVGPGGSAVLTFDIVPGLEWSTLYLYGGSSLIKTIAALDATVQGLAADDITNALTTTATFPPSTAGPPLAARWNSTAHFLQTRAAGGSAGLILMATLYNDTGVAQAALSLAYDMAVYSPIFGELPGYRVYFSLTGASNSWQVVPELSGVETTATVRATLRLGAWPNGSSLYILWADDNAESQTDPGYTIDNFVAEPVPQLRVLRMTAMQAVIRWPFPSLGYELQCTPRLSAPVWEAVSNTNPPVNGYHSVIVDLSSGAKFFRLRK